MSDGTADRQLRERARAVIPGGMYGHQAAPGAAYPQFMRGGRGARVWDVDGNEYVDLMCSYGPVVLGHQHPVVEAAARAQAGIGDCMNTPGPFWQSACSACALAAASTAGCWCPRTTGP